MRRIVLFLAVCILGILMVSPAFALEKVVSNSADWRDVYSTMLYASLIQKQPAVFLTSPQHGPILLFSISRGTNGTLIMSSKSQPYIVGFKGVMDSQGYLDVEEVSSNTINLDLAKRVNREIGIKKFIIVDDAYGYNALSAASYAVADKYYVLFVSERNIGPADAFLTDIDPEKIILFGQVDEVVKTRFAKFTPEVVNKGDRFENNIEMVKKYQAVKHSKQVLMSNGEFLEASIMSGDDPVLFIGRANVPQPTKDYVKESEFQVAVLIGNELINSATAIRRELGISVFVKFAQGARQPTGSIASVEDLDKFPMPSYNLNVDVFSITYNKATNQLWVTYKNNVPLGTYLKGTITIFDGAQRKIVGDADPVFIDKNQYKTIAYDIVLESDNITAEVYTLFGEGRKSMENALRKTVVVESISILDNSMINITDVSYGKSKQEFLVTVKNIGTVDTYVNVELMDIYINEEYLVVSSPEPVLLAVGNSVVMHIPVVMSDLDITNNPTIKVKAYYGERPNALIKTVYGEYAFKFKSADFVFYALIVLVVLLLSLLFFGKKKCPTCTYKNFRFKKKCAKCEHHLSIKKEHKVHHEMHHETPRHEVHHEQSHQDEQREQRQQPPEGQQ